MFAVKKFFQYLFGQNKLILVTDHKSLLAIYDNKKSSGMVANRSARWALFLNQFDFQIECRRTAAHQIADALIRLPLGEDELFDKEESASDVDVVCAISTFTFQMGTLDPASLQKERTRDAVIPHVMRFTREGWLQNNLNVEKYQKLADFLSTLHGCLLYRTRVVIPSKLRPQMLQLLQEGHFGIQKMKQLATTAVYWSNIDDDVVDR